MTIEKIDEDTLKETTNHPYKKTEEGVYELKQENLLMKESLCKLGIERWC